MRLPDFPDVPSIPSPGEILNEVKDVAQGVASGVGKAAGTARDIGSKVADLTGIGGIPGAIESSVKRIRDFTQQQIDGVLNSALAGIHSIEEFARKTAGTVKGEVEREVDLALKAATDVAKDLELVPVEAQELLADGERILKRAKVRRDELRAWKQRLRERKQKIPKILWEHLLEFETELEAELEQSALEAEDIGKKSADSSRQAYDKTVDDAKHYGGLLLNLTETSFKRAKRLKANIAGDVQDAENWAKRHIQRVSQFKSQRFSAVENIDSPADAQKWASETVSGAHSLVSQIQSDVAAKPTEIATLGQRRVSEAMELAKLLNLEVNVAKTWAVSQRSTNAIWKKTMRENRQSAVAFLESQTSRLVMKAEQHEKKLESQVIELGKEELKDTKDTGKRSIDEAKGLVKDIVQGDREDRLAHEKGSKKDQDEIEHPSAGGTVDLQGDPITLFPKEAPLTLGEDDSEPIAHEVENPKGEPRPAQPNKVQKPTPKAADGPEPKPAVHTPTTPGEDKLQKAEPKAVQGSDAPKQSPPTSTASKEGTEPGPKTPPGAKTASGPQEPTRANPNDLQPQPINPAAPGPVPIPFPNTATGKNEKEQSTPKVHSKVDVGQTVPSLTKGSKSESTAEKAQSASGQGKHESPPNQEGPSATGPKEATPIGGGPSLKPAAKKAPGSGATVNPQVQGAAPKPEPKPTGVQPKPTFTGLPTVVQKKGTGPEQPADPKQFHENLQSVSGPGESPRPDTRQELAKHIGFDPAMVRIHTGPVAAAAAKSLKADAFTIGKDIYFADKKYDPTTPKGLGLIAHEATHVGQQLGLKGTKLQFNTKSGGDAMEQEAQEIGERVASNVAFSSALRVSRYVRTYEPADDEAITSALSIKLDSLSMAALRNAGNLLHQRGSKSNARLDEVIVSLDIEMETMSDTEIVDAWAEAIASAIEAAHPVGAHQVEVAAAPTSTTHLIQRRLGDPANDPSKPEAKQLDPDVVAKLAKINPSGKEKDMIRQLAMRPEVDPQIDAIKKAKSSPGQYLPKNPTSGPFPQPQMPHQAFTPDEKALNTRLQQEGIPSWEAFETLKKDFISAFASKGYNVTRYILDENLAVVQKQIPRYLSKDAKNPDAQINKLKKAARAVLDAMTPYMAVIRKVFGSVVSVGANNLDTIDELLLRQTRSGDIKCTDDQAKELTAARNKWISVRQQHGNEHVVLLGRDYDPNKILDAKDDAELEMNMLKEFQEVEKNIKQLQKEMSPDKFWELHPMVAMTKKQMGVRPGEGSDTTVQEGQKGHDNDAMLWNLFQAAVSIALAITAMVATGGLGAVAMIASAGLSVYSAAKALDEYSFKSAAANSSLDQAKLLSKDQPALFWLAFELLAAGLDLGAAAGAFGKLASIAAKAKAASGDKVVLEELEKVARSAYKETKGLAMSEDDFVKRLLDSAKKAVPDAETFAKQAKLVTELLEATSPRAIAILKGDKTAIKGLIMEYGNWKGMMGALKNGGDDAAKMSKNIAAYRSEIIERFKARGASPLDNASTEAVSDFDLNVVPKDGKGAGERLLEFEKEMSQSFGPQWSEALLMNFYTDKSQLMAVDEALKMVKGTPEHAKILKRVTEKSEKLNFAKMLEHAGDSPAARQQVLELMQQAGVKYSLAELDDVIKGLKGADKEASRAAKLLEVDKLQKELAALPANSPERAAKLEKITEVQMEANFLTKEAYIGPAAVKGGALSNAEAYQSALSQLEMIGHVIGENGGDILKASREYELYKYINRYTAAAKKAGVETPRGTFFENYSNYIYKRAREGMSETAHVPGASIADEAADQAVDGKYLLDMYNEFRNEVKETLPKIKKSAEAKGGAGWTPEGPKTPGPAAGAPPAPKPAGDPATIKDYTKPGAALEPSKVAQLPAASAQAKTAADKVAKDKAKGKADNLGAHNAVTSAGFGHSKANEGIGMFKTRIPGIDKEVIVTVLPIEEESRFNQQLAAAIAAASTGLGPKVHGKIDVGAKKLGFAMDSVEGGIADAFNDKDKGAASANKAEMLKNAKNIGPATFVDVETFRDSIWDKGIRYTGPVDGFVSADGHWRPVNFSNTKPIEVDEAIVNYREKHDYYFNTLKTELMANHLEARKAEAKK